jgi:serine phosphatase RsbU (regulator of sigma subunit)
LQKKFYRTIEDLLRKIDDSAGDEAMLLAIMRQLVESEGARIYGIASGRLYRERAQDFLLIASIGEFGDAIEGKTVGKDYEVIRHLLEHRLWVTSPTSPGYDPHLESQFTHLDSAAIAVGQNPAYILSLGLRQPEGTTREELLVMLESIRAAIGLKLRQSTLENQLRQAQSIQMSLLPARLPPLAGFEFAAACVPAEEVGGDVYDLQPIEDGTLGVLIADASGHGLPAALQARDAVIGVRMGQAHNEKIRSLIQRLNVVIHNTTLSSRFISLFYAELEDTGNLTYVNAGHCPPLLVTAAGEVFELQVSGPVLGPLPDAAYRRRSCTVRPGELLVLFTDGVIERRTQEDVADADPVEFGRDRLIEIVVAHREQPAAEILTRITDAVREFGGGAPLRDDVTLLVIKREAKVLRPQEALTEVRQPGAQGTGVRR